MIPLLLALLMISGILWMGVVDLGRIAWEGLRVQAAVDAAAQTAAVIRARGLNRLGAINTLLGVPGGLDAPEAIGGDFAKHPLVRAALTVPPAALSLQIHLKLIELGLYPRDGKLPRPPYVPSGMGFPSFCWWPAPVEPGNLPFGSTSEWARRQRDYLQALIEEQENIHRSYGGGYAALWTQAVARQWGVTLFSVVDSERDAYRLRLKRNRGSVQIWSTAWIGRPGQKVAVPWTPVLHLEGKVANKRWLEQESDFYRTRQRFTAQKMSQGIPLRFARWLPVPAFMLTARSASRPYNTIGPMFPPGGQSLGIGSWTAGLPFELRREGWRAQRTR